MNRTTHMCLNLRGFLRNNRYPADFYNMLKHDDGRTMPPHEAHEALLNEIALGHFVIPLSPKCGNPCKQNGCAGFNYGESGGCPGYEVANK